MYKKIPDEITQSQERFVQAPYLLGACLQNKFLSILNHIQEGVLFLGLDGTILILNDAAKKNLNLSHDPLGQKFEDVFQDTLFGFSISESLSFGLSHKLIYRRVSGKDLEISSLFFCLGPKTTHGLFVFFRDVTRMEKERIQKTRIDRMAKLGEILSSITHEIKNPLGAIRGYASLLYRNLENDPKLQEMTGYILDGVKSLERMISNVLHFARPMNLSLETHEIGSTLRKFVQFMKMDAACPEKIQWKLHIPNGPILAPLDLEGFKRALFNLCINAYQAMGEQGTLTISLLKTPPHFQITISDTGIGMSEDSIEKLFTPLFTTKHQGNGLGLIEVKKIVEGHFGNLEVRSQKHKGTTFTLTFPLEKGFS